MENTPSRFGGHGYLPPARGGEPPRARRLRWTTGSPHAWGMRHGPLPHTSITLPVVRNTAFCRRATGAARGSSWGSTPAAGGVFVVGGGGLPLSQITIAEPAKG